MEQELKIYCDGGARGNPGPAGIGVVIIDEQGREKKYQKFLGERTNNQAEYEAVFFGLKIAKNYGKIKKINFYLDSELVVRQLRGEYKIKNESLGSWLIKIRNEIIKRDLKVSFYHIPRSRNHQADRLVNQAIDRGYK